jgi:eukaryotic-like serine/threonine-protein kinase
MTFCRGEARLDRLWETQAMDPNSRSNSPKSAAHDPSKTQVAGDGDMGATIVGDEAATARPAPTAAAPAAKSADGMPERMGDFKIIKKLGQGGMGAVYLAHQESLDRQVALKVMAPAVAARPNFVERFYREARSMAKLDHPNIVRGFAVGEANGQHYVAMELIDGKSMQDWLDKQGKLSVGDALHVAIKACDALQHAHDLGLIHRDIKPDNMLVTSKGVVKISDMGLAKQVDEDNSMTQSGTGLGTPFYMAPEQARNAKHVDARSDVYALGSTLYHFLTGTYPFKGESTLELIMSKEKGQFPTARRLNPEVPERLTLMIDKSLQKDPKHRYQSCADMMRDLEGLGLANATLSFIAGAAGNNWATLQPRPGSGVQAPTAAAAAPNRATIAGPAKTAAPAPAPVGDVWYVRYPDEASGKLKEAKLATAQVLTIIKNGQLSPKAKASKIKGGDYLPLAQFPEFLSAITARNVKQQADKKATDMKGLYAQIDRQDRWHKRLRWLRNLTSNTAGLISLVLWLVFVAALVGGGGYALWKYGYPMAAEYLKVKS